MTRVKICGITNLDDAVVAAEAGADELGFNFYPRSPRYIKPDRAAAIAVALPAGVQTVGVFVNEELHTISDIVRSVGLDAVQLHGDETPDFVASLRSELGVRIIKAFRVSPTFGISDVLSYGVDAVLLDAYSKSEFGGTGEVLDWDVAGAVRGAVPEMYLAGGLSPSNVAEAIARVGPDVVDACSLLESEPGRKDELKVRAFISNARIAL